MRGRYYGGTVSEAVLGECLSEIGAPREEIVVSTKCGRYADGFDFSAERVSRSVDESLARLKLDYVDILHCHDIEFAPSLDQVPFLPLPPSFFFSFFFHGIGLFSDSLCVCVRVCALTRACV